MTRHHATRPGNESAEPITCQHCPNVEPPEYIVGPATHEEYWCNRCVHNLIITTTRKQRPPIRLLQPAWSTTR